MDALNRDLLRAAQRDDFVAVQKLLDQNANANYQHHENVKFGDFRNESLDCPLRHAVERENIEMTRLLLSKGADPAAAYGAVQRDPPTVFDLMFSAKDPAFLAEALEHGASPENTKRTDSLFSNFGTTSTALHRAIQVMVEGVDKVRLLLHHRANANAEYVRTEGLETTIRMTALCLAIDHFVVRFADRWHAPVSLLLHSKANPDAEFMSTSVKMSFQHGLPSQPAPLPAPPTTSPFPAFHPPAGRIARIKTSKFGTALHQALEKSDVDLTFALLLHGASITPLRLLTQINDPELWGQNLDSTELRTPQQLAERSISGSDNAAELCALLASPPRMASLHQLLDSFARLPTSLRSTVISYLPFC